MIFSPEYLDAYIKILDTQDCIEMLFVKIIFLGPPRLGKTTARRRLTGKILPAVHILWPPLLPTHLHTVLMLVSIYNKFIVVPMRILCLLDKQCRDEYTVA